MSSRKTEKLLVAAIDFGTTFSSWACSFRSDYERERTKILVKEWNSGVGISPKAPTTALIRPDGETLHAFGYDAEDKYSALVENDEHKDWYYFRRFKMLLFKGRNLTRETVIEDESGKKLPAMTVISLVIRYLKDDLYKECESKIMGQLSYQEDVQWVLTVPAIWNEKARQFMREAAIQAGIINDQLLIALEPEAASLYCRHIPLALKSSIGKAAIVPLSPGTRYILVDAGGGTIDITIHEVMEDGSLKEIHKATGGAWGGQEVDEAFKQFLIKIFGNPVLQKFKVDAIEDYIGMFRDFEVKKRKVFPNVNDTFTFSVPATLLEIFMKESGETLSEAINHTVFAAQIKLLKGNKLRLDHSLVVGFFDKSVRSVLDHLHIFHDNDDKYRISVALAVGGFSESPMLSCAIRETFSFWKVLIPDDAGLIVLKGAVLYGHDQSTISYRVARFTYGVAVQVEFIHGVHPAENLVEHDDGRKTCINIFREFLKEGSLVKHGQILREVHGSIPGGNTFDCMSIRVYASTDKNVQFATDESCFELGRLKVSGLDMNVPREKRTVDYIITHESTDFHIYATDTMSGRKLDASIDLLN